MPNFKVLALVLVSLLGCTSKSNKSAPLPEGTERPAPGTNLGQPDANPAKLSLEVVDAAKFSQCVGSLTAQVKLKNSGESEARWSLKQQEKSGLTFSPSQGVLRAHEELTLVVTGTLSAADLDLTTGKTNIPVTVLYEKGEATLNIQEAVQGVFLQVDASALNFGVVAPKDLAQQQLTLTNLGKTDTQLTFGVNSEFPVNPKQITLEAGSSQAVTVSFNPLQNRAYAGRLLWVSSKPVCAALNPSVELQGQGSAVFQTAQKGLEWNQSCGRSSNTETQDIIFGLRKNLASTVSLESIEGPFTVDGKEWTVAANAKGTVKVTFDSKNLRPDTYRGRMTLKDKASGEVIGFDLQAAVLGSYLEIGTKTAGVFSPADPTRGINFSSSQVIADSASSPFFLNFVNSGNRPVVAKISLQQPITDPFISFPEASLTIEPGAAAAQSLDIWLQTHQVGKWDSKLNIRYESSADAPLCNQPPAVLPLHYAVDEDLDVEVSARPATYTCGSRDLAEFELNITNHSKRTIHVKPNALLNKSRASASIEGINFVRRMPHIAGTFRDIGYSSEYAVSRGGSIKAIIQVYDRNRFEATFKTGEKMVLAYSLRPDNNQNAAVREADINVDVAGAFFAVNPLELNFGAVVANTKASKSFQIKNEGAVKGVMQFRDPGNGFSIAGPTSVELKPAETALVTVDYTGSSSLNGSASGSLDLRMLNSCYSTGSDVRLSAVNASQGLSFETSSRYFALSRGESQGKACDEIPMTSFANRLRNLSDIELKYKVSIRLDESLRSLFVASDLMTARVDGQDAGAESVFKIAPKTLSQGPAITLAWLKDIRTLSLEQYRLLAEAKELGKVVITYADAVGGEIALPIQWGLVRVIPSAAKIDVGTLTSRSSQSVPFSLNILQTYSSYVDIGTEFKEGSADLTVTPSIPKIHTSTSGVQQNPLAVQLGSEWKGHALSGSLKINVKESMSRCPLLAEFSLPVDGQVKISELAAVESPGVSVTKSGADFQVSSATDCGSQAGEKTIIIKNNGTSPVSFLDFQWEALPETSPFALISSPADLQKTLEPGKTLDVKYQVLAKQPTTYYAEDTNRGFKRKLIATVSEDGEVKNVILSISDAPRGFFLPKSIFTTPPSFRQIQMQGNVAMKAPDYAVPVTGGTLFGPFAGSWQISSDFGNVQVLGGKLLSTPALGALMQFPADFTGTRLMKWTLTHKTLKNCSPNEFMIEGTKTGDSIEVSLDSGNTVVGKDKADTSISRFHAGQDGNLTAQLNFDWGKVSCGPNVREQFINIKNNTNQTMRLGGSSLSENSPWLPLEIMNQTIEPGKTGRIRVALDSSLVKTLGQGSSTIRYFISLVEGEGKPNKLVSILRVIQSAAIEGKFIKASVETVDFGVVSRGTTAEREINWTIEGSAGSNQLEFRRSLESPISDATLEPKLLEAFGSPSEREVFSLGWYKTVLSFKPTVTGAHSVWLQVVGGPAMKNICSAPTILVKGQGK